MDDNNNASIRGSSSPLLANCLLDSSLIVATKKDLYNAKLIECGNYVQLYLMKNKKIRKKKEDNFELELKKIKINKMFDENEKHYAKNNLIENIEEKNIIRSKLQCQKLAKANADEFKTFITLTFAENVIDIDKANIRLKYFIDKIRRIYKEFKYIGVPEFQKRGAVHYHLFTNIDINDDRFIYSQKDNEKYKHIKYWDEGFTKVDNLKNDIKNIIGYISKYMTKDADNRLYNRHRYFYSRNLKKPKTNYLNLDNPKHIKFLETKLNNKNLIYNNTYKNSYNDELIDFQEYL